MINPEILKFAKYYLKIGWSLLPIIPESKKPPISWAKYQEGQPTLEEVEEWLEKGWHLAVVTGDVSGVLVIDDDRPKHNMNLWGFESPVASLSENGGQHYFYLYDREIHSHSNATLRLDLKAWHSYCLLPPFGNRKWINKPLPENLKELKPISDEDIRLILSDTNQRNGERKKINLSDFVSVKNGARNDSIYKIACSLFQKMDKEQAIQILAGTNETYDPPLGSKELEYQISRALQFIESGKTSSQPNGIASFKPLSLTEIGKLRNEDKKLEAFAPKTGYPELDKLTKGFLPKHFWTLTGETNSGKTALALNFTNAVAQQNKKVLYVALEPENSVVDYLATIRGNKTFDSVTEKERLEDNGMIDIFTLRECPTYKSLIDFLKSKSEKYSLVVIDHIGYFSETSDEKNYLKEQEKTIRDLVGLTKELGFCVLAIAHPRKPSQGQRKRVLGLYDIRGSASFAQDSTEVVTLYRQTIDEGNPLEVELSNNGILFVLKSKSGRNGTVRLGFQTNSGRITTEQSVLYPVKKIEPQEEKEESEIEFPTAENKYLFTERKK